VLSSAADNTALRKHSLHIFSALPSASALKSVQSSHAVGLTRINRTRSKTDAHAHINTIETHCLTGTAHHSLLQHYPHTLQVNHPESPFN